MNKFGWLAKDNIGTVWQDFHFMEAPGLGTNWAQLVDFLERENRYIKLFSMRYETEWFSLPALADQYAFHYNIEVELGAGGSTSKTYAVGTAIKGNSATIRQLDEDGYTYLTPSYPESVKLMKPSPLNPLA
jgi:hypothetical protein